MTSSRGTREIEADLEQTRQRMANTIDAIENKLTPGQLIDQTMHYLRHNGAGEFASNLGNSVKQKPLPMALTGIGLGWLMMSGPGQRADESASRSSGLGNASSGLDQARATMDNVRDKAGDIAQGTREHMQRMRSGTRASAGNMTHQARTRLSDMMREQPLLMGALGIALGAALGASVAAARGGDEPARGTRDETADRTSHAVHQETTGEAAVSQAGQEGRKLQEDNAPWPHEASAAAQSVPRAGVTAKTTTDDADDPNPAPNRPI